jgi:site-specific DNA-methyltransferase (adenine-specific)
MMAYLARMALRLVELHRVLKPTGSMFLHCDPTASHYLKLVLDAVFGPKRFLNEIVWQRTSCPRPSLFSLSSSVFSPTTRG